MDERREFPRIEKRIRVEIRELSYPIVEKDHQKGSGNNIGIGGVCIRTDHAIEPGTLVELDLDLSGLQAHRKISMFVDKTAISPLTVIGKVAWIRSIGGSGGYEAGVEFLDIYEDDRLALEKYLNVLSE